MTEDLEPNGIGFKTGFCHFCRYEVETKPYMLYQSDKTGQVVPCEEIYLCDFCAMLSRRDRENKLLRNLNWGLNHVLKTLLEDK